MHAQTGGGRGGGERGDSGLEVGLELFCAMGFPGCGVAGEDYELWGKGQYDLKRVPNGAILPAWFLCVQLGVVVLNLEKMIAVCQVCSPLSRGMARTRKI